MDSGISKQSGNPTSLLSLDPWSNLDSTAIVNVEQQLTATAYGAAKISLDSCLMALRQREIQGPQLFRASEFSSLLGGGALFNVYGCSASITFEHGVDGEICRFLQKEQLWAIKRPRQASLSGSHLNGQNISLECHIEATFIEIEVLSYPPFRDHPNIVKLLGWGLCLDDLEDENYNIRIPHLILERGECTLDTLLSKEFLLIPPRRALSIDICEGLRALHDADLAHGVILLTSNSF